jgi:hypothetical protein
MRGRRRFRRVGGAFHFGDEGLRRALYLAHEASGLAHDFWKAVGAEEQERQNRNDQDVGEGKHRGVVFLATERLPPMRLKGLPGRPCKHQDPP